MVDTKRHERGPAEGSHPAIRDIDDANSSARANSSAERRRPAESFPPFNDPAFSSEPAEPPPAALGGQVNPPKDTQYARHPEFSQDAANNRLPPGEFGNSEPIDHVNKKTRHSDGEKPSAQSKPYSPSQ